MALRGVNLGGWLVLEQWMTPSLFAGTETHDEYTFMQTAGALEKLREHQRSFVKEEDFRWMAANGINAVRIPIGYWVFDGDGPYKSCIGRLDWAIRMAKKYRIVVVICLHGAPGSQNGEHHSGRIGEAAWYKHAAYRTRTADVLVRLAQRYAQDETVWGLELLNEPKAWFHLFLLRKFYRNAYASICRVGRPGLVTLFSDAFMPRIMSGALRARCDYPVVMDTHWYQFFVPKIIQRHLPLQWYYRVILPLRKSVLQRLSRRQPVIVGEWSGILGGETLDKYPVAEHQALVVNHIVRQMEAFGHLAGWFYWNYKTEARGIYHLRSMIEDEHITITE